MLQKIKTDGQTRLAGDKKQKERRRNIIILILRYLMDNGMIFTAPNAINM
jgi:hypothetical protein